MQFIAGEHITSHDTGQLTGKFVAKMLPESAKNHSFRVH